MSLLSFNIKILLVLSYVISTEAYDPLDPNGNITIRWDIMNWAPDGYEATITMFNFQKYRHIEQPGWTLGWTWTKKEFIWSMLGGKTIDRGDCSSFTGPTPHCCKKNPQVVDLLPDVPIDEQVGSCCRGGVMSSLIQDTSKAVSRFQITVGGAGSNKSTIKVPKKFKLRAPGPGYTCGAAEIVKPTIFYSSDGRRAMPAFKTWNVTCMYSPFLATEFPTCCVSLSAFYDDKIVDCPKCACGCQRAKVGSCVESSSPYSGSVPEESSISPLIQCSNHMCPVRVHWHIKQNYRGYWRVQITIANFNLNKNYSEWNAVVQHPNFNNLTRIFSFNYYPLAPYDGFNDTAMLWGLPYFNDILLQAGPQGYVQSEILVGRDRSAFTWENGWAFPRRIYFNGDMCVMPDAYPQLPAPTPRSNLPVLDPALVIMVAVICYILVGAFCKIV